MKRRTVLSKKAANSLLIFSIGIVMMIFAGCSDGSSGGGTSIGINDPPGNSTWDENPNDENAIYRVHGLNFSPYMDGQNPDWGSVVPENQIRERMEIIEPYCNWIRTFGVSLGLEKAPKIARDLYLETAIGAWLDSDPTTNEKEMATIIDLAKDGHIDIAIIGSETLYRNDLTPVQLIDYIEKFRNEVPWVPVSTGEVYTELLKYPDVIDACDLVLVNYYPYWEGKDVDVAMEFVHLQHQRILAAAGDKEVIVSETGWPSDGDTINEAEATLENACKYFLNFVSWARAEEVKYFYFEAFDESWKVINEGPQGAHWGVFDKEGKMKPCMEKVFLDQTMDNNWSCGNIPGGTGTPDLEFTYVPPKGSRDYVKGQVWHVDPSVHAVAVYIYVAGGWWTKPYWNKPLTFIDCDGSWACDYTTGGVDHKASKIAAFMVPIWYDPPSARGGSLSSNLYDDCVDYVIVSR